MEGRWRERRTSLPLLLMKNKIILHSKVVFYGVFMLFCYMGSTKHERDTYIAIFVGFYCLKLSELRLLLLSNL